MNIEQKYIDRFWSRVSKSPNPDGCWEWIGSLVSRVDSRCYGRMFVAGRHILSHRLSWVIHFGDIPEGEVVCHNCPGGDNPRCIRPEHLFLGTQAVNMHDCNKKGRAGLMYVLSENEVREARKAYASGESYQSIGRRHGVTWGCIYNLVNGYTWRHLT